MGQYPQESQTHKSSNTKQTEPSQDDGTDAETSKRGLPERGAGLTHEGQTVCSAHERHKGDNVLRVTRGTHGKAQQTPHFSVERTMETAVNTAGEE